MDVKLRVDTTKLKPLLARRVRAIVAEKAKTLVTSMIDAYLEDLEKHMGTIPGASGYSDSSVQWSPLSPRSLENEGTFWYDTGKIQKSLVVNIDSSDTGVRASLVIADKEAYNEFLWNELGFTASSGKLIRRPLFIPLAQEHLAVLKEKLQELLSTIRISLRLEVK